MKSVFKQNVVKTVSVFGVELWRFMPYGYIEPHIYTEATLAGNEVFYESEDFPEMQVGQKVYIDGGMFEITNKATAENNTIVYLTDKERFEEDEESRQKAIEKENKYLKEHQEPAAKVVMARWPEKPWWKFW